jgi:low affinity Fe/Cu permease
LGQGFPSHLGNEIDDAIDKLVQKQIIIIEKKTKEEHVCLNMKKIKVITKAVDWFTENAKQIDKKHLEKRYLEIEIE